MKQDRLNIHYEALYEIIVHRYSGLTPDSIKQKLIHSEFDFEIENPLENTGKTLVTKKEEYIYAEVSTALKRLSKLKKTDEELEDYDDTYYFDEEVSEQQKADYKYYSHTIVIGEPKITTSGRASKRNAYYRLNKNIQFSTTDNLELKQISNFLYLQFTNNEEALVDDDMVNYITGKKESTIEEDENNNLLADIFVQITTHKDRITDKKYSLHLLLALASLQSKINIQVNSKSSTYTLKNIAIDSLVFNKDTFDIKCDGIQFSLSSIEDIKLIESASSNTIRENVQEAEKILDKYSQELQAYFKNFVNDFMAPYDIFFQDC